MVAVCIGTIMIVVLFEGLKAGRMMKKLKIGPTFDKTSLFRLAFTKPTERSSLIQQSNSRTDSCRKYRLIDYRFSS